MLFDYCCLEAAQIGSGTILGCRNDRNYHRWHGFFFFYSNIVNSRYHKEFVQEIIWLIIINVNNDSI